MPASAIEDIVSRLLIGAFYQSGQSCIGVQRILIHESHYVAVRDALVAASKALPSVIHVRKKPLSVP